MADWKMEDVLRMALRLELENFAMYKKASEETQNPGTRAMFRFLADEERSHIRLIRDKMAEFDVKE